MKDMKMIEDMVAKMLMMGKGGMGKNKMEEGEYEEEDYSEDEGYEQDKVTIKFCGKDALKKAHDLLMGSYKK
jgi:major membrane immunogen (membrane-anchored lipoprotein)